MTYLAASYFGGYVSDIEIMWVLIALFGAVFSAHNLNESRKDLAILKERGITNGRQKIAKTGFRAEVARLTVQVIFITVGIIAMTFQDPPAVVHEPLKLMLFRFIFQWGFIVGSAMLSLSSYWNWSLRRDLLEHGVRIEPHELAQQPQQTEE